jgi:hypothetical protein
MDSGFTHFDYSLHDGRRVHIAARIGFSISPDPDDPASASADCTLLIPSGVLALIIVSRSVSSP